ncbi:hypothetical protein [Mycolicibacterium mageritense]|nr:hypothetical protein [Mycolicibacterium mageritense]
MSSDDVRDFVERDKALISAALDGGRDVLAEMLETIRELEGPAAR